MNSYAGKRLAALAAIAAAIIGLNGLIATGSRTRAEAAQAELATLLDQKVHLEQVLAGLSGSADAATLPADLIWPGQTQSEVESHLQETILDLGDRNGLVLATFSPAGGPPGVAAGTVGFVLEGSASWDQLLRFVNDCFMLQPAIGISEFSARNAPQALSQPVAFRIALWGLAPGGDRGT